MLKKMTRLAFLVTMLGVNEWRSLDWWGCTVLWIRVLCAPGLQRIEINKMSSEGPQSRHDVAPGACPDHRRARMWRSRSPNIRRLSDLCSSLLGSGLVSREQEVLRVVGVHRVHPFRTQPPIAKIWQLLWGHGHRVGKKVHPSVFEATKNPWSSSARWGVRSQRILGRDPAPSLMEDSVSPLKGPCLFLVLHFGTLISLSCCRARKY